MQALDLIRTVKNSFNTMKGEQTEQSRAGILGSRAVKAFSLSREFAMSYGLVSKDFRVLNGDSDYAV